MLPGSGLGDHTWLAHPFGEQRLAERVVQLVRARVHQVLALQVDRPAALLREALGQVKRRRPAGVVAQQALEVVLEAGVVARGEPGPLELVQRRDQGLRHVAPAVVAEAPGERLAVPHTAASTVAALMNASTFAGSLMPGDASVPLALSTPHGCVPSMAACTL